MGQKEIRFSERFRSWCALHDLKVHDGSAGSGDAYVARPRYGTWEVRPGAGGMTQVGHLNRADEVTVWFEVAAGDDLERVLYYLIGEEFRFQRLDCRAIEFPRLAKGWTEDSDRKLVDPAGVMRYHPHASGAQHPKALSHILQVSPRQVAKSYDSPSGQPLRRIVSGYTAWRRVAVAILAGVAAFIAWAAGVGDTALTVMLFALTAPPLIAGLVVQAFGVILNAADSNAMLRGRALFPVAAGIGFAGIVAEVGAVWLASQSDAPTWYYPLAAAGIALAAAAVMYGIGILFD
ncbi:hypothetical protein ACWZHB_29165 [Nocardia sp. FBN12]|uniref:hypothetical protein n=1 Tax=Nocardia sp. FBN12 TaxID=3419766 RepID=UPI003D0422C1